MFDGAFGARLIMMNTLGDVGVSVESVIKMIIDGIHIGRGTELYWILVGVGIIMIVVIAKNVRFTVLFESNSVLFVACETRMSGAVLIGSLPVFQIKAHKILSR